MNCGIVDNMAQMTGAYQCDEVGHQVQSNMHDQSIQLKLQATCILYTLMTMA